MKYNDCLFRIIQWYYKIQLKDYISFFSCNKRDSSKVVEFIEIY